MIEEFRDGSEAVFERVVEIRRDLHRQPELSGEEHGTAERVADVLGELGLGVETEVFNTGVVGTLEGAQPGPTVLLRADTDALPIQEETGLAFASENAGVMHACGHDFHTSSLLGTAMILAEHRDALPGEVRFCFQPHEERMPGGAKFMIEEGVLDGVDAVFGQHVKPDLPAGVIGVRPGAFMASSDEVYVTVEGEGGHAANPHEVSADATYVASEIVVALQSLVSRRCSPGVPSVLTIGKLIADGATNVIPERARLEGTFRAMDKDWRFEAHDHFRRIVTKTAEAHGATADVEVRVGYPALSNDAASAQLVQEVATDYVGAEKTVEAGRWYAGEDFAYFLRERPGAFYQLGVGSDYGLHTSRFNPDEEALRTSTGVMAAVAWEALRSV